MSPEEIAESKVRANAKRRLRRLWVGDSTVEEMCEELGLNQKQFEALAEELGLGERGGVYLPTQEDIRRECAKFRMSWSQHERESRLEASRSARMT